MNIVIYSTASCPFCGMLKDYLSQKGVSFIEKLVDQDEAAREEMISVSGGFMGVPFTSITRDDGKNETIMGFDKGRIDSILGIIG